MHIPDGYLSPLFSLGSGVVTVPVWARTVTKVRAVLNQRTIPLLALFAAICFTIMLFTVPVPGGTGAHAVGGTLIAVVLGPEAAVLALSTALIIQALFFGDGGILTIFTNCLNLAIILPYAGYFTYQLIAAKSPILSIRRVWAAAIGAYVGLTAAALAIGIEIGLQPLLFSQNGKPLYSPYPLSISIPAMLLSATFATSIVEALITAFGLSYFQRSMPEVLTAPTLRSIVSGADVPEGGEAQRIPLWRLLALIIPLALMVLFLIGLITGEWNVGHLFGADWSQVNWADIGTMLLIVAVIAIILIPLTWFALPRARRKAGVILMALAILLPLGLISPGFVYEGGPSDIKAAFGYVPQGFQQLSGFFSAPFSNYNVPLLPFFQATSAPLWHVALGLEISGIIGILLIGGVTLGIGWLISRRRSRAVPPVASEKSG